MTSMITAFIPGSFDPPTNGHLDIIRRASALFDHVVVAVGFNQAKPGWMPVDQRVRLLREIINGDDDLKNVRVEKYNNLTTDAALLAGATVIVKGARSSADWEWEYIQASVNRDISGLETYLLPTAPKWATLSSSIVRELATFNAPLEHLVPAAVSDAIRERLAES